MKNHGELIVDKTSYWGLFYKIEVFDGGKKLLKKYCRDYHFDGKLIIAGSSVITPDGRCSKILEKCEPGLYLALNFHIEEKEDGNKRRISTYLVIENDGRVIISLDKESMDFSDLETVEHNYLSFKGDYFEVVANTGIGNLVGAYSLGGTLIIPCKYANIEMVGGYFLCHKIDGEADDISKGGVKQE